MPRKAREKSKSGIYHIIFRGTNKQEIFHDNGDTQRFLKTLLKYKDQTEIKVYGWCFMGNHLHLLLEEGNEDISVTMKRIAISYAWYYNMKYKSSGNLFHDRFLSENLDNHKHLLTVLRYIHQDPVKSRLSKKPSAWKMSSCKEYYDEKPFLDGLLDKELVLGMFADTSSSPEAQFKEFNEDKNDDHFLDYESRKKLTDYEAKEEVLKLISPYEISHIKTLPKDKKNELLLKLNGIEGMTHRQVAKILEVSPSSVFRAWKTTKTISSS